jgi:carbamoyltransferase
VDAASNPVLYRLLEAFDALTGVPVLVNTSFNVKGEPMVETPQDAMACFLETGIDYLVLHDTLIGKSSLHRVLTPIVKAWSDVRRRVRAAASA